MPFPTYIHYEKSTELILREGLCLMVLALLNSCNENGPCIKGQGNVETRQLQVNAFTGVSVNGDTRVYIQQGPQQRVEVKGEPNVLDALETDVRNNIWKVDFDRCFRRHETVEVYITVPDLQHAELNGSGSIEVEDNFTATEFKTYISGSGKIIADFTAQRAATRISGSGTAELSGTAASHDIHVSGSGKVKSFNLATENTEANISGSGLAEVTVSGQLTADISGSGRVIYQGNPTSVNSNVSGSGSLTRR